jgi:hypothetical protein
MPAPGARVFLRPTRYSSSAFGLRLYIDSVSGRPHPTVPHAQGSAASRFYSWFFLSAAAAQAAEHHRIFRAPGSSFGRDGTRSAATLLAMAGCRQWGALDVFRICALTIHSSRHHFVARLNSDVRIILNFRKPKSHLHNLVDRPSTSHK